MTIELSTPLHQIKISNEAILLWDKTLIPILQSELSFSDRKILPYWSEFKSNTVDDFLNNLSRIYNKEFFQLNNKKKLPDEYQSLKMLAMVKKDGIDFSKLYMEKFENQISKNHNFFETPTLMMYLQFIKIQGEFLAPHLLQAIIEDKLESKKYSSYDRMDETVEMYFKLLSVTPVKNVTYDWFIQNLNSFCQDKQKNMGKYLNYDNKKLIHDYIKINFPDKFDKDSFYFSELTGKNNFFIRRLHQSSIQINLFQILHDLNLGNQELHHIEEICIQTFKVVSSKKFLDLIGKNIDIENYHTDKKASCLELHFSSENPDKLKELEQVFLTALKAVLPIHEKIHIVWSEDYDGNDTINSNLNAKFLHQYYLHQKLNDELQQNSSHKKNKI